MCMLFSPALEKFLPPRQGVLCESLGSDFVLKFLCLDVFWAWPNQSSILELGYLKLKCINIQTLRN